MKTLGVTSVLLLTLVLASPSAVEAQVEAQVLRPNQLCSDHPDAAIATFEDANMEAAIRAGLSVDAQDDLTCGLIYGLTELDAQSADIMSLVGIQNLTSLTTLNLGNNSIPDIGSLGGLTSLFSLNLVNNPDLTDIQTLLDNKGLGAGDEIRFGNTKVRCTDLAGLAAKGVIVDGVDNPELSCVPLVTLPDEPVVFNTFEQPQVRVVVVTKGLSYPWGMAFLPGGDILVTERPGRLRVIRDGVLDPEPIAGVPEVLVRGRSGLLDITLHPRFVDNNLVYLTYSKAAEDGPAIALARGRFDGSALRDVRDIFVADSWGGVSFVGSRIVFAPDGTLYMTVGGAGGGPGSPLRPRAQDPSAYVGKVLRLRDDGSVPDDNPFVGRAGYKPEIFSLGHRNQEGAAIHPETGALWTSEHAPQGGDEVNVILSGRNYGWPVVSYGREYDGPRVAEQPWQGEMEQPVIVWLPSIAPSGLTFYTGNRFPAWEGNLFAGGMMTGRIRGTGHLERIVLNGDGEELRRESLLGELKQRIRDVQEGPDGLLYVLTAEDEGALLRIEPARPH